MTIRSIGAAKLATIMLVVLIAAAACAKSSSSSEPVPTQFVSDNSAIATPTATVEAVTEEQAEATTVAKVEQATGALFLEMTSPDTDELFVSQNSYEFSGRTTVDALLSVNDNVLEVDEEGRFSIALDLEEGPNVVEVVASNSLGEQYDHVLLVFYEPV